MLTINRVRRIDWARIIANLQTAGMSLREVADAIDASKSSLFQYTNEDCPSEPAYYVGHSLVALWCTRCGTRLEDVPIKHVPESVSRMMRSMP